MRLPLHIFDVASWKPLMMDTRGKRGKMWIVDPLGIAWLRKQPIAARPYEIAIECIALRLARAMGLRAAEAHLCHWADGTSRTLKGIIVRNFLTTSPGPHRAAKNWMRRKGGRSFAMSSIPTLEEVFAAMEGRPPPIVNVEEFASGAEVLEGTYFDYDKQDHTQHTPERVYTSLTRVEQRHGCSLLRDMARLLFFDAWIGNGDRHQENWGVVFSTTQPPRLAPVYDPAACLGAELQATSPMLDAARRTAVRLRKYIEQCPSGFGDENRLVTQSAVVEKVRDWPEWKAGAPHWLAEAARVRDNVVGDLLADIPNEWLLPWRKQLAALLLDNRLAWLERIV